MQHGFVLVAFYTSNVSETNLRWNINGVQTVYLLFVCDPSVYYERLVDVLYIS